MTAIEYDILKYIHDHPRIQRLDVVNAFDPQTRCRFISGLLDCLISENLVASSADTLALSGHAFREMASFEQKAKDKAEHKRERRKDQLVSAAIAVISALVGALLSHF